MSHHVTTTWYGVGTKRALSAPAVFCISTARSHQTPRMTTKLPTARIRRARPGIACFGVRYVRMKPRRRRGSAADGAGPTRAAGMRLNGSPLQRVDEVGIHRIHRLHRAVDLPLGFPEVAGRLDVVVDLAGTALGSHDLLALLQIEEREGVEVGLHVVRRLAGGLGHDPKSFRGVLLEPVEG